MTRSKNTKMTKFHFFAQILLFVFKKNDKISIENGRNSETCVAEFFFLNYLYLKLEKKQKKHYREKSMPCHVFHLLSMWYLWHFD